MKKILISLLILISLTASLTGQIRTHQAGLRTGFRSGIFYQVTGGAGNAEIGYNALASFNHNGLQITGLRIIYGTSLSDISRDLYLAWGYGAHVGFETNEYERNVGEMYPYYHHELSSVFGIDGWGSVEYRFSEIPLNISLNLKPYIEISGLSYFRFMPADIGISVAYVF